MREGRLLALTDEGRDYYRSISAAFSVLRSATRFVRDRSSLRQITVSLIPLLGIGWFIPRLHAFLADNTDVDVTVLYAHHRNYRSDASDLSIRFGTGDWPGYRCERLLPGAMVPMCSPSFLKRHGPFRTPADLARARSCTTRIAARGSTGCRARASSTCRMRSGRCSRTASSR